MNKDKKILICYNEPFTLYDNYSGKADNGNDFTDLSESEFFTHLNDIKNVLSEHFNSVEELAVGSDFFTVMNEIEKIKPDIIFNFVESIEGKAEFEVYVAGMYDILGISFTGCGGLCLANCLDKNKTKQILSSYGIDVPNYLLLKTSDDLSTLINITEFPVILKLNKEDASIGISEQSVVFEPDELIERVNFLRKNYNQDILIEQYIEGREFNIAILDEEVLPISEINFKGLPENLPAIVTYEAKWSPESTYYKFTNPQCPANIDDELQKKLSYVALEAYYAMECRDYARVDIRLDKNNVPYVIEVNPNPDISIDSGFVRAAKAANISYSSLILKLAELAIERIYSYDTPVEEDGQTSTEKDN